MATGQQGHVDPETAAAIAAAGGKAAGDSAEQGQTSAEAQTATADAMRQEAQAKGVTISDEDINKIAEGTIAMLEARGAFDGATATGGAPASTGQPPTEPPSTSSDSATSGSAAPTDGGSQTPPAATPSTASGEGESRPRRRTFAERFQGKA
jgi:hypothetical protein